MKNIVILGSTGSIGTQTLEVAKRNKKYFRVIGLSGHRGESDLIKLATLSKADLIVNALVGDVGIEPTLAAIRAGKNIAMADKEAILCAGKKMLIEAKKYKVNFIPIDSEHTGIFQILHANPHKKIKKIVLTCSGGPFYNTAIKKLARTTPTQVLKHPRWNMGKKVSIDSATLINKGFEVIECCILYGVKPEQVEILYHPESVIHCIVEFIDGSVLANMSEPDMKIPIEYALFYPNTSHLKYGFPKNKNLTIGKIKDKFGLIALCRDAAKKGLTSELCKIDSMAVEKFLNKHIGFLEMIKFIKDEYSNIARGR